MIKLSEIELKEVLRLHIRYLEKAPDGKRADLRGVDLQGANLSEVVLIGADLIGADLSEANLRGADLRMANLSEANLSEASLRGADLGGADLRGANLRGANLSRVKLIGAIDRHICRMDFGGWSICIRSKETTIGCKTFANQWWLDASDSQISELDYKALTWWKTYGSVVKEAITVIMELSK